MIFSYIQDSHKLKLALTLFVNLLFIAIGTSQTTITSRIASDNDDAEERLSDGFVNLTSSDLELISDGSTGQLIGLRFQNINIPQGTTILNASIQFTTDQKIIGGSSAVIYIKNEINS
ncbi:hypothetical protein [Arenibacter latericius]|uniref:hypothetical protein n=1 Tax=Arenibacter latericius TaxID=86104 RepID=UPI00041AB4CD|nr:hypothetical protein [Arenibacter latericius]MDX1364609.1 hypothetical protein [Arenibacter latericius]